MAHRNRKLPSWSALVTAGLVAAACGGAVAPATSPSAAPSSGTASSAQPADSGAASGAPEAVFTPIPDASQAPDTGSGAAHGDIPDNAVFLTYRSAAWRFSIQYVEGWQVRTVTDGVTIRDKDSSETVRVVTLPSDLATYISDTDLPALRSQPGFSLIAMMQVEVPMTLTTSPRPTPAPTASQWASSAPTGIGMPGDNPSRSAHEGLSRPAI